MAPAKKYTGYEEYIGRNISEIVEATPSTDFFGIPFHDEAKQLAKNLIDLSQTIKADKMRLVQQTGALSLVSFYAKNSNNSFLVCNGVVRAVSCRPSPIHDFNFLKDDEYFSEHSTVKANDKSAYDDLLKQTADAGEKKLLSKNEALANAIQDYITMREPERNPGYRFCLFRFGFSGKEKYEAVTKFKALINIDVSYLNSPLTMTDKAALQNKRLNGKLTEALGDLSVKDYICEMEKLIQCIQNNLERLAIKRH